MRESLILYVLAVLCLLPAWASEPGEPLDCDDWTILEAGVNCVTEIPFPCKYEGTNQTRNACSGGPGSYVATGDFFFVRQSQEIDACGFEQVRAAGF